MTDDDAEMGTSIASAIRDCFFAPEYESQISSGNVANALYRVADAIKQLAHAVEAFNGEGHDRNLVPAIESVAGAISGLDVDVGPVADAILEIAKRGNPDEG